MRENAVPCLHATQWETLQERHTTWNDSRICNRCESLLDIFATRRMLNEQFEEDGPKAK